CLRRPDDRHGTDRLLPGRHRAMVVIVATLAAVCNRGGPDSAVSRPAYTVADQAPVLIDRTRRPGIWVGLVCCDVCVVPQPTWGGVLYGVVLPRPSSPLPLYPQHSTVPSVFVVRPPATPRSPERGTKISIVTR